ncbi:MAG: glycosyl hydrolase family 18 protein [Ilumatobacter sp.]
MEPDATVEPGDSVESGEFIEAVDPTPAQPEHPVDHRRRGILLGAIAALLVGGAGVAAFLTRGSEPLPPKPDIALDAWVPYWTLDASTAVAELRLPSMRDVSPFWFNATGVDTIEIDPNARDDQIDEFLEIAAGSGASVIPSIVDALPAGGMAEILADPETRGRHVDALVAFAADGDHDGIDLDYEQFAFADGRDTWAATRPNWISFVEELSERLRTDGRTLTVSIPPVYDDGRNGDSGFWVYDHGAIAPFVDRIRIMAYDFSFTSPGPIAPLDFVQRSIDGALETTGAPEKIVLGIPAYGRNWPTGTTGDCTGVETQGVTTVNARTVDELIERRRGVPEFDASTGEWSFSYDLQIDGTSCVQQRQVHYVDADGVRLRMDLARQARLGGVALWAFGFDDVDVWREILPTVDSG